MKMRICFIGATGHADYALENIGGQKDIDIVAVAPGSEGEKIDNLEKRIKSLGYKPKVFEDYIEMLDKCKPDIAVIACYFGDHARVSMEAIKRKIHVFVEKPVSTTLEELEQLKELYANSGVHLTTMLGLRYTPWFLTAWKAINQGAIGTVRLMNAQKSYRLGNRNDNFKNRKDYGGTIPWVGSHAIDWLYWFSGERFKSVFATHTKLYNQGNGELEISALCHFTLTNDVYASVSIDYLRPQNAPGHSDDRIRIVGTKGIIEVTGQKAYIINDEAEGIRELSLVSEQFIFMDFLRQIKGEGKCMISAEDAFYITEACLKARLSADENRVVNF